MLLPPTRPRHARDGVVLATLLQLMGCHASPKARPVVDNGDTGGGPGAEAISMSGVAYQFQSRAPLEGARVSLVELPGAVAFSDADGRWRLDDLPADTPLTPRVELEEHATGHHQTFRLGGPVERVFLQVVPQATYDLLVGILGAGGNEVDPESCQIVTTIAEPGVAEFDDWEGFLERGDAGLLANADATITPEAGTRLYFNEQVIPDPAVERSTLDGGVLWLNVPPEGAYTLRATHSQHRFPDVDITCAPGRFINASPPWGLTATAIR